MFEDNKYTILYHQIVEAAKKQPRDKAVAYFESHHVTPRSLGGSNAKSNLVLLTAREHFLCHYLLTKMCTGSDLIKMLHAFMLMRGGNNHQSRYLNGRLYEAGKIQYAKARSIATAGIKLTEDHKQKISAALIGRSRSDEVKAKISSGKIGKTRKPFTDEQKAKISAAMRASYAARRENSVHV